VGLFVNVYLTTLLILQIISVIRKYGTGKNIEGSGRVLIGGCILMFS
jgi:hypothetical protein